MAGLLEQAGIPYMVAGSVSSSFYGNPRSTRDVDIVIDPDRKRLDSFLNFLGSRFYASRPAALEALESRGMFNIIDTENGWKVDLIIRKDRPFSREEFARRRSAELMGLKTWVVSPEDSILSKLEWTKGRDSTLQLQDATQVLIVQWGSLDFDYLRRWAIQLDVVEQLEAIIDQARSHRK